MISTSERGVEHPFAGQNTQQLTFDLCHDHSNSLEVYLATKLQIPNICKTPQI